MSRGSVTVRRSKGSIDFEAWVKAQGGNRAAGRVLGVSHTAIARWIAGAQVPRGDGERGPAWLEERTGVTAASWHVLVQVEAPARPASPPPAPQPRKVVEAPPPPESPPPVRDEAPLDVPPADDPRWRVALANLIAQGGFKGRETLTKLRTQSGMTSDEVAIVVADAAALCAADRGSADVTLEVAVSFYGKIRDRATDSNDFRTALAAQGAIDKLLLTTKGRAPAPPPASPPAAIVPAKPSPDELQASAMLGVVVAELANWPEARAAVLAKLRATREAMRAS